MSTIVQKSKIQPGQTVLDVGFGCGDSCKYLADKVQCQVTGITIELSQIKIANETLDEDQKQRIELLHGSADNLKKIFHASKRFDHIISVDSAYHFNTRWKFFKNAYNQLKDQDGTLSLFDIALHPTLSKKFKTSPKKVYILKLICKLAKIPECNILATPDEYEQKLYDAGFKDVQLQVVPIEKVFGGIARHVDQQLQNTAKYGINISITDKLFLLISRYVFSLLARNEWITPVFVSAKKNESA